MGGGRGQGFAGNQFFNLAHRRINAGIGLAFLQIRAQHIIKNALGIHIGNRAFQAAPHRQMGFAFIAHQQQQHTVAHLFAPRLILLHRAGSIIKRRFRRNRGHGEHDNLAAFFAAVLHQMRIELGARFGLHHLRAVEHRRGERRNRGQIGRPQPRRSQQHQGKRAQALKGR